MYRLALLVCLTTVLIIAPRAQADVMIEGSTAEFTSAGIYAFDFTVTAVNSDETIIGFTMPLLNVNGSSPVAENPDTSLSDIEFTPNPFLESKAASSDFTGSGFGFSISADDGDNTPLVLAEGQSAVLFSIPMNVVAPGLVLTENVDLSQLMSITSINIEDIPVLSIGPASAVVSANPEPSSTGLLAMLGGITGLLRRRIRV